MSKDIDSVIEYLVGKIDADAVAIAEKKRTVNSLCKEANKDPIYPDVELTGQTGARTAVIRPSQFYGKTPIVASREYLDVRGDAVALEEILDALERGGFDFAAQGWSDALRLRNLGISLSKNTAIFHRLPNGMWGLLKWYPNVKTKKSAAKDNGKTEADAATGSTEDLEKAEAASN
jgi:hypothetical protein